MNNKDLTNIGIDIDFLMDSAFIGIAIFDNNDDFTKVNDTFLSFIGYTREDIIGKNMSFFGISLTKKEFNNDNRNIFENIAFQNKNGEKLNCNIKTKTIIKNNKNIGTIAIITDCHNYQVNSHDNIYNFTDYLSQTLLITDNKYNIKNITKFGFNFLNIKDKYIINILDLFEENDHKIIEKHFINTTNDFRGILKIKVFNKYIRTYVNIISKTSNKKIIGYSFVFTDLSEFSEIKKKFSRSEEQYKLIFRESRSALLMFDYANGMVFEANDAVIKIIDNDKNLILNSSINDIIQPNNDEPFFNIIKNKTDISNTIFYIKNKAVKIAVSFIEFYSHKYYQLSIIDYSKVIEKEEKEAITKANNNLLSETAHYFLQATPSTNIYSYIAKKITQIVPNCIALSSSFNGTSIVIEAVDGIGDNYDLLIKTLPQPLIGAKVKIRTFRKKKNITGLVNLNNYEKDGHFGFLTDQHFSKILKQFGAKAHYSMLITNNDEILGQISIMPTNNQKINKKLIETFGSQAGIAIQKIKLEKQLITDKETAEDADKLKTAFLANMSHEIRTPVNSIIGFSEMLSKENLSKEQKDKYVKIIDNSGNMLINLIDDIIDITKIETGQLQLTETSFKPFDIVKEIFETYKSDFKNSKIKFIIKVDKELKDIEIYTDKYRFKQVLLNLITNALKFTHKGKVNFGFTKKQNNLDFFVIDTGQGISTQLQSVIFERFNRGNETKIKGSGLGLSISKQLVDIMGGNLRLKSEENKGSAFYVTIPIKKKNIKKTIIKEKKIKTNWENKTVLIVDDEELNYELLKEILAESKININKAINGKEAIEMCSKNNYDLVLMDVKMPIMDGFTATSEIIKQNPEQKIIAQTAYAMSSEKEKAIKVGCIDFITKPIRRKVLLNKIDMLFNDGNMEL